MKFNPLKIVSEMGLKTHVGIQVWCDRIAEDPMQRRIMMGSAMVTFGALTFTSSAFADGDGFAGMASTGATQADSITTSVAKGFKAVGLIAAGYGGFNWWKKGQEGSRSDIKASNIFVPILAGAALAGTGFVMGKAGETVGIQTSTYGQVP
ncbi:DUF6750 family protein [Pseudomonas sp. AB12(2023)]|uniref:DUF6750 family protein n=1 Tax=Pseudomonas sp. AB12(2023) TaxID=3048597 RepID=UPI002B234678|nr:DUF6750 family protein [Pseudomonas sp. AB12(2023)]MEB0221337.1 hypothetical protein [Pseudomonas sp. AB12(2023)]